MDLADILYRLGIAVVGGLLVGVERHWREREAVAGSRTAGIRSYAIIGLLGGLAGALAAGAGQDAGMLLLGFVFLGLTGAMVAFRLRESAAEKTYSVTGVLAAQATFAIGALAVMGDPRAAGAAAVALTALLASRDLLHGFVRRLRWPELRSAVLLLSMTFVALPLVPNRRFVALGGLNPSQVWRYAIVLAAISFVGYLAVRLLGQKRGRLLAGAATGLVSSTAATLTLARASRQEQPPAQAPLAAGALIAGAVAWLRTAALAWWVSPAMTRMLLPALVAGALVQGAAAWYLARGADGAPPKAGTKNPFDLLAVLKMALLLAAVALAAELAAARFGGYGLGIVAAISALADVDAVTLSMGDIARGTMGVRVAAQSVLIAVLANTIAKSGYAIALGGREFAWRFAAGSGAALLAAVFALLLP